MQTIKQKETVHTSEPREFASNRSIEFFVVDSFKYDKIDDDDDDDFFIICSDAC